MHLFLFLLGELDNCSVTKEWIMRVIDSSRRLLSDLWVNILNWCWVMLPLTVELHLQTNKYLQIVFQTLKIVTGN